MEDFTVALGNVKGRFWTSSSGGGGVHGEGMMNGACACGRGGRSQCERTGLGKSSAKRQLGSAVQADTHVALVLGRTRGVYISLSADARLHERPVGATSKEPPAISGEGDGSHRRLVVAQRVRRAEALPRIEQVQQAIAPSRCE